MAVGMKTISIWVFILVMIIVSAGESDAVLIKDNKGRTIEADLIEADKESVKVRKTGNEKVFTLQRATLSPESNTLIDEFLKARTEEETKQAIGTFEMVMDGGPNLGKWKFRMKQPLKSMKVRSYERSKLGLFVINAESPAMLITFTTRSEIRGPLKTHIEEKLERHFESGRNPREEHYGEWSGYIIKKQTRWFGLLRQGDVLMDVDLSQIQTAGSEPNPNLVPKEMLLEMIKSITMEKCD